MATVSITDPKLDRALRPCIQMLRHVARFELEPALDRRIQDLGERKEFLGAGEHDELLGLVAFTQKRTLEKLEAQVALERLHELFPEMVDAA
jgi:hypothetical protein